ncbi:hypothetical protein DdX_01355 [Ditylenchus destructor]|uniref:EGF-like domain-containing protein n=1 Tax=Ditylenchus destructor TaxID=166010 RepID=A0AAD4NKE9_9BILA|nr:hypothetical protein DdX_01355 [Ditylenchus destructor]
MDLAGRYLALWLAIYLLAVTSNTVNALTSWAFLSNQADCKLSCLNGGVCAFDTNNPTLHKCICFIGLFEGERCEIPVAVENDSDDLDVIKDAKEPEDDDIPQDQAGDHEPSDKEIMARMDENDPDSYETEMLTDQEPTEETNVNNNVVIGISHPEETTEDLAFVGGTPQPGSHKFRHHNVHLVDNGPFTVESPFNPQIKHYENTRASTRATNSQPLDPAVSTAWERRPMSPKKSPQRPAEEENFEEKMTANRPPPKKKGRKKQKERERDSGSWGVEQDDSGSGGWMMSKRHSTSAAGSRSAALLTSTAGVFSSFLLCGIYFYFNMF